MARKKTSGNAEMNERTDIKTPVSEMIRKFKRQKNAVVALFFIVFLVIIALVGEYLVPYGINEYDYSAILQGPSMAHWFGTDEFGRDLFSRIVCGTRISLAVGLSAVTVGAVCGTVLGLLGGYYGGFVDSIIMRICDTLFAFPGIILAIAIVAILGSGLGNVVIAVAVFSTPTFARLVRSRTLALKHSVFVQAARNLGASDARILFRHLLPNVISSAVVFAAFDVVMCMLTGASMSFLGLGVSPPTPEWGAILNEGRTFITFAWWETLFPGLFLAVSGVGFSLLGDGLTDFLRTKGR